MIELTHFIGTCIALFMVATLVLLSIGVNFAPQWAKSRPFLMIACAIIVVSTGAIS